MSKNSPKKDKRKRLRLLEYSRSFKDKPCTDCKIQYPPVVMQFDHLEPLEKDMNGRRGMSALKSKASIFREISKCEVVCANCHALRTEKRRTELQQLKTAIHDFQQRLLPGLGT